MASDVGLVHKDMREMAPPPDVVELSPRVQIVLASRVLPVLILLKEWASNVGNVLQATLGMARGTDAEY